MKKTIYIYHHLGLGDHIILNGFVRDYLERYDSIYLFSKPVNAKNVAYMYRDNPKIHILALDDPQVRNFMQLFTQNEYLILVHSPDFFRRIDDPNSNKTFDQLFFEDHNIPLEYKWSKFKFERNIESEDRAFYDIYGLKDDEEYIFIHESKDRPVTRKIPKDIKQIRPDKMEVGLFDHLKVIEKSLQVHVMNSSFMNLIDCIQLRQEGLFYHEYSRPNINTILKLPWEVLK